MKYRLNIKDIRANMIHRLHQHQIQLDILRADTYKSNLLSLKSKKVMCYSLCILLSWNNRYSHS
jgi:hypothetical protein